jgi:hypothetical protein
MMVCKNGKFLALGNGAAHADAFSERGELLRAMLPPLK